MYFTFSPTAELLLVNQEGGTIQLLYNSNPSTWSLPLVGLRPPYYANPQYILNYPVF